MDLQLFNSLGRNKFHNTKVEVDGIKFDSKKEAKRYQKLKILESEGIIRDLERQKVYELIPKMPLEAPRINSKGNCSYCERAVVYKADFAYRTAQGKLVVEDVKGIRTPEYIIKRKLMKQKYNIEIREV